MHILGSNAQCSKHIELLVILIFNFVVKVIVVCSYLGLSLSPEYKGILYISATRIG